VREGYRRDCHRRKPNPGMIEICLKDWSLAPENCLLIGDKETDLEAARACGVAGHLFKGGNLLEFAAPLLEQRQPPEPPQNV
jgi:D-glycero-D-manno-heptose 1,7-bisphosphate phosphatase